MSDSYHTTAPALNVRAGAGTAFPVIVQLPRGTRVSRLETSPGGDWFRISTESGVSGWIAARFALADLPQYRVTATTLNLRSGPGTDQPIMKQLPNGCVVTRLEATPDGTWMRVRTEQGTEGWASSKWFTEHGGTDLDAPRADDPSWYSIAWAERGVKEYAGSASNPRIDEYQAATNYPVANDEVHWCSSFVNWVMKQAGLKRTNSAAARSWLQWGKAIDTPVRGCVVVLKRGNNPQNGHVAFFVSREGGLVRLLGGNQGNQVQISRYKVADVISYRMPA